MLDCPTNFGYIINLNEGLEEKEEATEMEDTKRLATAISSVAATFWQTKTKTTYIFYHVSTALASFFSIIRLMVTGYRAHQKKKTGAVRFEQL
jgi:di/tricarboxylate transporter